MAIGGAPKAWRAGAGSATAFTVADLTPAAMLSPVLQPPEIQYPVPVELPPFQLPHHGCYAIRPRGGRLRMEGHSAEVSRPSADANRH